MQPDAALVLDRAAAAEQPSPEDLRAWTAEQRVFISSVMAGLEEERAAVAEAVAGLGAEPVWFERFGGRDDDAETAYLSEVASSSVYVGLLAERYGRPLPSRYSATHLEYREAEQRGCAYPCGFGRRSSARDPSSPSSTRFASSTPRAPGRRQLAPASRISMEYRNAEGRLAYYYPDFAVHLTDGGHLLVEAKGLVDLDVPAKDRRAAAWAVDATITSGTTWRYLRVDQEPFEEHRGSLSSMHALEDLMRARTREEYLRRSEPGPMPTVAERLALMEAVRQRYLDSGDVPDVDEEIRRLRDDSERA